MLLQDIPILLSVLFFGKQKSIDGNGNDADWP